MENQSTGQIQPDSTAVNYKNRQSPLVLILIVLILLITTGTGAFWFGQQYQTRTLCDNRNIPVSPSPASDIQSGNPVQDNTINGNQAAESIKSEIENSTNPKTVVELIAESPADPDVFAYLGGNESGDRLGIYVYHKNSKQTKTVFQTNEVITGRGGGYLDVSEIGFSPTGGSFFVNRTGINFPAFIIADINGTILFQSRYEAGHATWVNGQKLLYLSNLQNLADKPVIFDTISKTNSGSNLPGNIFRLKSNNLGNKIVAYKTPVVSLKCESFDLHVFQFPAGTEIKTISNTTLEGEWTDANTFSYDKVTSCVKNEGEPMYEYSPVTEKQTLAF